MKRIFCLFLLVSLLLCSACASKTEEGGGEPELREAETADLSEMDFSFSDRDMNGDYGSDDVKSVGVSKNISTITSAGTYEFSGSEVHQILVSAGEQDKVQIVLCGATIANSDGPAIYISSADKVFITAKENTENVISDGESYEYTDEETTVDGAIFSKADLTLNGAGSLLVTGNAKHGIVSKDDLVVTSSSLTVTAKNVGLSGKDCVKVSETNIRVTAGSDAIRSDNTEDASRGYVYAENATLDLTAANDGIQAETALKIENCTVKVKSGSGSSKSLSGSSESYKGLKAASDIVITGGSYTIDSTDDAIHSNHTISITGGDFVLSSGDDGIHADTDLSVSGGVITISKSYEALEGTRILISGGRLDVTASDDGLNAAGGNDASGFGGRPGMGNFSSSTGEITITDGYLFINASGDGIDANGSISVSGGITLLSGPTNSGNGAFDYDTSATVTGGVLIALGSSGMAQGFSNAENQGAILANFTSQSANTSFALCDEEGKVLCSFTPPKAYQCAVVTCPEIKKGERYTLVAGGTYDGVDENGYVSGSALSGGTELTTVTMSDLIYSEGAFGMGGGMGGGMPGGMGGGMNRPGSRI